MTIVTINETGVQFAIPETSHEVFLHQLITFERDIEPTEPPEIKREAELLAAIKTATKAAKAGLKEELAAVQKKMSAAWYRNKMIPYMCRVLGCFTNQPPSIFLDLEKTSVEDLYYSVENVLFDTSHVEKQLYYVDGEVYMLPGEMLKSAIIKDWIEASYFFEAAQKMDGRITGMLEVCAALLKKEGETLNEDIFERNKKNFVHLSLFDINCVAFFLLTLTQRSGQNTTLSFAIQQIQAMRRKEL